VAVRIYVVAEVGDTVFVPIDETVPISGLIETDVAPLTSQVRVAASPEEIEVISAAKVVITGLPAVFTVTVTDPAVLPTPLVAVSVYTVVEVGDTVLVPVDETLPISGLIETDVAPVTPHESVEASPEAIEVGLAVKLLTVGSAAGVTVIVADVVDGPVLLEAVMV